MVTDRQLADAPDDGYWQSLLQDAEQAEDVAAQTRPIGKGSSQPGEEHGNPGIPARQDHHTDDYTLYAPAAERQPYSAPTRSLSPASTSPGPKSERSPAIAHALSHEAEWQWAQEVFAHDETVEGVVTGFNRGGLLVKIREMAGFVPASHMVGLTRWTTDEDRSQQLGRRIGEAVRLKVIELSREQNRFILSERLAMGRQKDGELLLHTLQVGAVCSGKVNHITEFGAFVDLGGIDGLIHVSELAWERVSHPRDVMRLGQEVQVLVVSIDIPKRRIQLSIKRLPTEPWPTAAENVH